VIDIPAENTTPEAMQADRLFSNVSTAISNALSAKNPETTTSTGVVQKDGKNPQLEKIIDNGKRTNKLLAKIE
jgi:hypothetical protein